MSKQSELSTIIKGPFLQNPVTTPHTANTGNRLKVIISRFPSDFKKVT